jgi:hypothetical protein
MELKVLLTHLHSTVLFQSIYLIFIVASSTITVLKWAESNVSTIDLRPVKLLQPRPLVST